jgi:hypothetical protein
MLQKNKENVISSLLMRLVLTSTNKEPATLEVRKESNRLEKFPSRFKIPLC